jgi:outer membrane protein
MRPGPFPCALLIALLTVLLQPGFVVAADLTQAFLLARESDPRFRGARFDFEAATFAEPQARAALLPTASLELIEQRTRQNILDSRNPVFASGSSSFPTEGRTLNVTLPIYRLSAWRGYWQSKVKVQQAAATFSAAEQDLIVRVSTAYFGVLAARDVLEFAEAELKAIAQQLELIQQRFKSGLVAIVELHDTRARHATKEAEVVAARNDLDDKMQALREITGKVLPGLKSLREEVPLETPSPSDMDVWVQTAQKQNLLLEARRRAVEVAQQEIGRQRAGHVPVLDVVLNNNRRDTGGSLFGGGSNVDTNDVIFRFNLPLYSGGLTSALTSEAVKRHQSALEDQERDMRQVERQTRFAFQGVTGGVIRVRALAQGVVSAESARELKAQGYRSGLHTILQVLDAERDLYAAKRDAARARYDLVLNRLRLLQASGALSESDLMAVNALLR